MPQAAAALTTSPARRRWPMPPDREREIEADLAELVDDDRGRRHAGLLQHVIENRRLAAAEKTGQQGDRNQGCWFGRDHRTAHSLPNARGLSLELLLASRTVRRVRDH